MVVRVQEYRADHSIAGGGKKVWKPVDVAEAVEMAMNDDGYRDGELERLHGRMDSHARFVGALVDKLVTASKLSASDLEDLLTGARNTFSVTDKLEAST